MAVWDQSLGVAGRTFELIHRCRQAKDALEI